MVWVQGANFGVQGWWYETVQSASKSESFGYHWCAHMMYYDNPDISRLRSMVAPGDTELNRWFQTNVAASTDLEWIFPSSYWFSPSFWTSADCFAGPMPAARNAANHWMLRRNKTIDVYNTAAKVLLFENKDFVTRGQPQWNTVRAKPAIAVADGSGRSVDMANIIAQTGAVGAIDDGTMLRFPCGIFGDATTDATEHGRMEYGAAQGFTWTYGQPAYFWRTRNGIRGRDLMQ